MNFIFNLGLVYSHIYSYSCCSLATSYVALGYAVASQDAHDVEMTEQSIALPRVLASGNAFPIIECSSLGFAANGPDQERRNRLLPDPLPLTLSDSTHGEIKAFELITIRLRDSEGAEGVEYTYTVGRNGGSVADILRREIPELIESQEADDTEAIWQRVWWALHYGGRGGPCVLALSARIDATMVRRFTSDQPTSTKGRLALAKAFRVRIAGRRHSHRPEDL